MAARDVARQNGASRPAERLHRLGSACVALATLAGCTTAHTTSVDAGAPPDGAGALEPNDPVVASEIASAPGATGEGYGDPSRATNGVRGGGDARGSTDVYSLDYGERSTLVLGWSGRRVHDGPGADFVVFENGFGIGTSETRFMDLVVVSVSTDGETWLDLPHDYLAEDETVYSRLPRDWAGFAGCSPVLLHAETNPVDPFDSRAAGGDAFDLESLGSSPEAARVRAEGARYVRLTSAPALTNPDTGAAYVHEGIANGADIDGVIGRYLE